MREHAREVQQQAQAKTPLAGVRGLVFLGFPLHPAGKPSTERAAHLLRQIVVVMVAAAVGMLVTS